MLVKNAIALTVGALAGCTIPVAGSGHPVTGDPPQATADPLAHVDENLARLQALDVFTVGQLVVDLPAEAHSCYGPCPGSQPAIDAAKTRAATRLAELADTAEKVVSSAAVAVGPSTCETPAIDANLAALSALRIVGVSGLVVTQPANNPQCYNLPCPADKAAAQAANCARAGKLAAIVAATKGI
jgi:hypothetical protein